MKKGLLKIGITKKLFQKGPLWLLPGLSIIFLSGCEFFGNDPSGGSINQYTSTLPPDKAEHVRDSLSRGDLTRAVNRMVDPPVDGEDCGPQRAPASVPQGDCPSERFENKSVLYLGDSHSVMPNNTAQGNDQRFGHVFGEKLQACAGTSLHYHAYCGSRPRSYTNENGPRTGCGATSWSPEGFNYQTSNDEAPNLSEMMEAAQPQEVVINLGDNMFGWRTVDGKREAYVPDPERLILEIDSMIDQVPEGATCSWIGPTYHAEGTLYRKSLLAVDQFYAVLQTAIQGRCRLIDSRPFFTTTSPNDGLHLIPSESSHWASEVLEALGDSQ